MTVIYNERYKDKSTLLALFMFFSMLLGVIISKLVEALI